MSQRDSSDFAYQIPFDVPENKGFKITAKKQRLEPMAVMLFMPDGSPAPGFPKDIQLGDSTIFTQPQVHVSCTFNIAFRWQNIQTHEGWDAHNVTQNPTANGYAGQVWTGNPSTKDSKTIYEPVNTYYYIEYSL